MARPSAKKAAKDKGKREEQHEEPFQAVLLTDTYESRFQSLASDTPRCLLPLCGTPLLDYTLEFLSTSGVYEVILYTGAYHQQIVDYLNTTRWLVPNWAFRKVTVMTSDADSVGAAMRHLDQLHVLEGDFLVVSGDVICTVEMEMAIRRHKARRLADKNAIMTIITKLSDSALESQTSLRSPVFVTDVTTGRILQYEEYRRGQGPGEVVVDQAIMEKFPDLEIRQDLVDCRIDICTLDSLALWTDSFDWEDPRRHFLHGTLKDYELNGKKIYLEVFDRGYASRVNSLQAYDTTSRDILEGWSYPITPESNIAPESRYRYTRSLMFVETENSLYGFETIPEGPAMIGAGAHFKENCRLKECVIGRHCSIGANVSLDRAYIWDNVKVDADCRIGRAIIGSGAAVGAGSVIEDGAIVGPSTIVAAGSRVKPPYRPSRVADAEDAQQDSDDESDTPSFIESTYLLPYHPSLRLQYPRTLGSIAASSASSLSSRAPSPVSSLSSATEAGNGLAAPSTRHRLDSTPLTPLGTSPGSFTGSLASGSGAEDFVRLATNDLYEHFAKGTSYENVRTEFLSLRMGRNATEGEIRRALVGALCRRIKDLTQPDEQLGMKPLSEKAASKQVLDRYAELVRSQAVFDYDNEMKPDQNDLLLCLQRECGRRGLGGTGMQAVAIDLYSRDILEEQGIMEWWEDKESQALETRMKEKEAKGVRDVMVKFVQWLQEAQEESSGEE